MGPLRISGTTSRLDCSRQLRRCVAQLCPIVGVVKPGGGMNMWKRPLLPIGKLSKPGRPIKALGHYTMQRNAVSDMQCTMLIKKPLWSMTSRLQSFVMERYPLTGSRVSLSASTRERGMHWKGATTAISSWLSRSWKSWRGLWTASSDSWCQSTIPSLASSQAEAHQTQSLLSGSCKRII